MNQEEKQGGLVHSQPLSHGSLVLVLSGLIWTLGFLTTHSGRARAQSGAWLPPPSCPAAAMVGMLLWPGTDK